MSSTIQNLTARHSSDGQLFLSIDSQTTSRGLPTNFRCFAPFLPSADTTQTCPICLEIPERSYSICTSHHTTCEDCLKEIFKEAAKNFKLVNKITRFTPVETSSEAKPYYHIYAEKEMLPKCPFRCEMPSRMLAFSEDPKCNLWCYSEITWLNYRVGQTIAVTPDCFEEEQATLSGTLDDGTMVSFLDTLPMVARKAIEAQQQISATILTKTVENGWVYLKCSSVDLFGTSYAVGQEVQVTIAEIYRQEHGPIVIEGLLNDGTTARICKIANTLNNSIIGQVIQAVVDEVKETALGKVVLYPLTEENRAL